MLMHNSVALLSLSLSLSGWTDEAERPSRETTIYIGGGLMDAWALFFFLGLIGSFSSSSFCNLFDLNSKSI